MFHNRKILSITSFEDSKVDFFGDWISLKDLIREGCQNYIFLKNSIIFSIFWGIVVNKK